MTSPSPVSDLEGTEVNSYLLALDSALSTVPVQAHHSVQLPVPEQVLLQVLQQAQVLQLMPLPEQVLQLPVRGPADSQELQCRPYNLFR
jgi:hypothetical protein